MRIISPEQIKEAEDAVKSFTCKVIRVKAVKQVRDGVQIRVEIFCESDVRSSRSMFLYFGDTPTLDQVQTAAYKELLDLILRPIKCGEALVEEGDKFNFD